MGPKRLLVSIHISQNDNRTKAPTLQTIRHILVYAKGSPLSSAPKTAITSGGQSFRHNLAAKDPFFQDGHSNRTAAARLGSVLVGYF